MSEIHVFIEFGDFVVYRYEQGMLPSKSIRHEFKKSTLDPLRSCHIHFLFVAVLFDFLFCLPVLTVFLSVSKYLIKIRLQ